VEANASATRVPNVRVHWRICSRRALRARPLSSLRFGPHAQRAGACCGRDPEYGEEAAATLVHIVVRESMRAKQRVEYTTDDLTAAVVALDFGSIAARSLERALGGLTKLCNS
jgi:hypothetical protein